MTNSPQGQCSLRSWGQRSHVHAFLSLQEVLSKTKRRQKEAYTRTKPNWNTISEKQRSTQLSILLLLRFTSPLHSSATSSIFVFLEYLIQRYPKRKSGSLENKPRCLPLPSIDYFCSFPYYFWSHFLLNIIQSLFYFLIYALVQWE